MSLTSNISASYASQLYTALIGIVLVPVYLQHMGSEAYGVVGFFAMLQAWFNLLDLGLTPTMARESARYHGGAISALAYRRLHRSLSLVFVTIAVCGGVGLLALAGVVTTYWLNVGQLPPADVVSAIQVMAVCIALRWMGGLYRGIVTGAERLVWLGGFNALIATLRFVGVLATMWLWGFTLAVFFWHQLSVAALELAGLLMKGHGLLPRLDSLSEPVGWSFKPVQPLLRFSLTIAFTSSVWVLVTQTDKLILSGILPLAEYGYFTLAVLVAGGITVITSPVSTVIMPRMARLHAEGKHQELTHLYNQASQFVSVVAGSVAATLVVCAEPLLYAWTGSREVTEAAAPILRLYAIGNGLLALGAFPYYLQYARGNLRYHLIGNLVLTVVLIPAIIVAATRSAGIGAGWAWVVMNAVYLLVWVGYVHSKLQPGLHWGWLMRSVFGILLPAVAVGLLLEGASEDVESQSAALLHVSLTGISCLLAAGLSSSFVRQALFRRPWTK